MGNEGSKAAGDPLRDHVEHNSELSHYIRKVGYASTKYERALTMLYFNS